MHRWLLVFFFVAQVNSAISADLENKTPLPENGVANGIGAGGTVFYSWGFIYRRHFENHWGLSTSMGGWLGWHSGHLGNEIGLLYSVAHHQMAWSAMPNASIRVYLVAILGNIYRMSTTYYYPRPEKETVKHLWDVGLGAGPGVEFFFNKYFSLHAELPWMTFMRLEDKSFKFRDSHPHFGGGFVYYF